MQAEVWARRVHHVEAEIAKVDLIAFFQPDIDIDRYVGLVEHFSQHREIVAQHDLVGGEPMRGDIGAAMEMIGRADVVEMFVAQYHHVDLLGCDAEMVEAGQEMRIVRRQADVDHDRARAAAHQIGVRRAVLEADLVDVLGRLDQRADVAVEQGLEGARPAVAHEFAALLKTTAFAARNRLESASMIISAKAGCWLTR